MSTEDVEELNDIILDFISSMSMKYVEKKPKNTELYTLRAQLFPLTHSE